MRKFTKLENIKKYLWLLLTPIVMVTESLKAYNSKNQVDYNDVIKEKG